MGGEVESQMVNSRNIRGRDPELWMVWRGGLIDFQVPGLCSCVDGGPERGARSKPNLEGEMEGSVCET